LLDDLLSHKHMLEWQGLPNILKLQKSALYLSQSLVCEFRHFTLFEYHVFPNQKALTYIYNR